ncbi:MULTISPECIES: serine hydrolase [unclassified Brevundimonas]|uniref:serine hydrolase domain-containing protein n=1 Tax=unclassified Brevundimonas TaxID=2622653 RepID=UPI001304B3DC|nr:MULTISPECIES: serine hydrolase domain-containing protein [unclassified Brevundimonas]
MINLDRRALLAGLGAAALSQPAWATPRPGLAVPGVPAAPAEHVGMSAARLKAIDAMMNDFIARKKIPGAVTAIARHNRLVQFQAYGQSDPSAGVAMRLDSTFPMMSSTKPVTAVALLQQIDAGRVRLDDPISKFIPELKTFRGVVKAGVAPPAWGSDYTDDQLEPQMREITIKDLATHTSGLNAFPRREPGETLGEAVPRFSDLVLAFQPGSRWGYSPLTGADVLARVVEITSGQSYDLYLQDHIFDPVGMTDTTYVPMDEQRSRQAKLFKPGGEGWVPMGFAGFNGEPSPYKPGGFGLISTARDYLLFQTMLLNEGAIHGRRILSREAVALMHSNLIGNLYSGFDGDEQGLGFGVLVQIVLDSAKAVKLPRANGAYGWQGAFGTMTWTDPALDVAATLMMSFPDADVQREFQLAVRSAVVD